MQKYVPTLQVTVLTYLTFVCEYLAGANVNILDISQTIVDGYFNMMTIVDVTNCSKEVAVVSKELEEIGTSIGVAIHCQREEIFEKMHRL